MAIRTGVQPKRAKKRRKDRVADWQEDYRSLLGTEIVNEFSTTIDQMIPQSGVFICGTLYQEWLIAVARDPKLESILPPAADDASVLHSILSILRYGRDNPNIANKGWPSLLKSKSFFDSFVDSMKSKAKQQQSR